VSLKICIIYYLTNGLLSTFYSHQVRFALRESQEVSHLLTFAIYGNYYYNDCTFGVGTAEEQLACGYKNPKI